MKKLILIFLLPITVFSQNIIQNNINSVTILPSSIQTTKTNDNDGKNVAIGLDALKNNNFSYSLGFGNVAIGASSLFNNSLGALVNDASSNIAIGENSLFSNTRGSHNIAIGSYALNNNRIGNNNLAIGYGAGYLEISSDKLHIENNINSVNSLIWGDFSSRLLGFHGKVGIQTKTPTDLLNIHDSNVTPQSYARFTSVLTGQTTTDGLKIGISEFNEGIIFNYENKPIHFGTNSLNRMTIHENGNVGINNINPIYNFVVQNPLAAGTIANMQIRPKTWAAGSSSLLSLGDEYHSISTTYGVGMTIDEVNSIFFKTNNISRMTILNNGNVGIGNGFPTGNFHVQETTAGTPVYFHLSNFVTGSELTDGLTIAVGPQFGASIAQRENAPLIIGAGNGGFNQLYLKENGNIGINTDQPDAKLDVNGYTKLGSDAPKIKLKKIITNTGANQGDVASIPHGLTSTKIIAVNVLVDYGTGEYISHHYTISGGYEFHFVVNTSSIEIKTKNGNSGNILSKPVKILITYEE